MTQITRRPGEYDPRALTGQLLPDKPPGEPIDAVLISEIRQGEEGVLQEVPSLLSAERTDITTLLIGVVYSPQTLERIRGSWDMILAVDPEQERRIDALIPFVPAAFQRNPGLGGIGSAWMTTVDPEGLSSAGLIHELRARTGTPLHHEIIEEHEPTCFAIAGNADYFGTAEEGLGEFAPVIFKQELDTDELRIVGFVFINNGTEESNSSNPFQYSTERRQTEGMSPDLPGVPTNQTKGKGGTNMHVEIERRVLNKLAKHVLSTPETESFAALYADRDTEKVVRCHIIENERYLNLKSSRIEYNREFAQHMKWLAEQYREEGFRLCGDLHSHPSGSTNMSEADRVNAKNRWKNERNHRLIAGIVENGGETAPGQWKKGGKEAHKQYDEYEVRIAAYAGGTCEEKDILIAEGESRTGGTNGTEDGAEPETVNHAFADI